MAYLSVVTGLVLLIIAGDILVRGSVSLARRLGIPTLVIGLTIVAFGTSAPELVVGVKAVLADAPTLALGNVVGSNIANILLVIGTPALILPISCSVPRLGRNIAIMLAASVLMIAVAMTGTITWHAGAVFVALLGCFLGYSALRARTRPEAVDPLQEFDGGATKPDSVPMAALLLLGGLVGLAVGADLLVGGSVDIATAFGVSEAVIGLTLVALGTSLPELATAVAASWKGHGDVAVGNVVGSNIFNILGIVGVSSLVGDLPVPAGFTRVDLWIMLGTSLMLVPFYRMRKKVGRKTGAAFITLYGAYILYLADTGATQPALG